MSFFKSLIKESMSKTISNEGKPVLEFHETYRFFDTSSSSVNIQQASVNFSTYTSINCGTAYANYTAALARPISVSKLNCRPPFQAWEVNVDYTTDCPLIDDPDPSHRRIVREVSDSEQQRFVFRDRNNKLIVDSAGSPFDGGVPVNVRLTTYNWEKNTDWASYNLDSIGQLSGKINADTFLGKEPGTLLLSYRAKENWEGIYHYAAETFTMVYDPLGWKPKPANAGFYQLVQRTFTSNAKTRERIKVNGKPATEPEPLYTDGSLIPYDRRPQDCNFITIDYYDPISFSALNLPTT